MMHEWCSCGASIKARTKHVLAWRASHTCPDRPDTVEPQGAHAQVEHAGPRRFEHGENDSERDFPIVVARMGFVPNE